MARRLTDAEAVHLCATGTILTRQDVDDIVGTGFTSGELRVYGLTADHSAILPIRSALDLGRNEWAGFWKGVTTVPIRRA